MEQQQLHPIIQFNDSNCSNQHVQDSSSTTDDVIQQVMSHKKQMYRLEIRKRKLKEVFSKIRKLDPPPSLLYLQLQQQQQQQQQNQQQQPGFDENVNGIDESPLSESNHTRGGEMSSTTISSEVPFEEDILEKRAKLLFEQNRNLKIELETKSNEFATFEIIAYNVDKLNKAIHSFTQKSRNTSSFEIFTNNNINNNSHIESNAVANPSNSSSSIEIEENNLLSEIDQILIDILKLYLQNEASEEIASHFKQIFLHMSLLGILKNSRMRIETKNNALWCLINLSYSSDNQLDVVDQLVQGDIIPLIKTFLKDVKYAPLYENMIWLCVNIAVEKQKYREIFIEEGFIYYLNNYLNQISKGLVKNQERNELQIMNGISFHFLKVILNFCVAMLSSHNSMELNQVSNSIFILFIHSSADGIYLLFCVTETNNNLLKLRVINGIMNICVNSNNPELFSLCVTGMQNLFSVHNTVNDEQFFLLFEQGFLSRFFMGCVQNEEDGIVIGKLFRHLSFLRTKYALLLARKDLCMPLYHLLDHPLIEVRVDMAFSLSNFLLNGKEFVSIASQMNLDKRVIVMLENECWDIQREAVYALASLLESQDRIQQEYFLMDRETFTIMCKFFNDNYEKFDEETTEKMLQAFKSTLEFGEYATERKDSYQNNPFYVAIEWNSSVPTFEYIITHGTQKNSLLAQEILENYSWSKEIENDS